MLRNKEIIVKISPNDKAVGYIYMPNDLTEGDAKVKKTISLG